MKPPLTISDELLSAYIDHQIGEAELQRVEMALAAEPALQQRLEALKATVALLQQAPSLVAPRAFVLSENQVLAAGGTVKGVKQPSFWDKWLPRLMPAATAVIAVLFLFSFALTPQGAGNLSPVTTTQETAVVPMARGLPAEESQPAAMGDDEELAAPKSFSTEQRGAAAIIATDSVEDEAKASEAPGVATGRAAPGGAEAADEAEAAAPPPETKSVSVMAAEDSETTAAIAETEPHTPRVSWVTWLLGLLLVLFGFLSWKVTLGRSHAD